MKSVEFVLWANGAAELIGDEPPTKEQWLKMREKLGEAVGTVVASKLLEKAEEAVRHDELAREQQTLQQLYAEMRAQKMPTYRPFYGIAGTATTGTISATDNLLDAAVAQQRVLQGTSLPKASGLSRALGLLSGKIP